MSSMFPSIGLSTNIYDNPHDIVTSVAKIAEDFR